MGGTTERPAALAMTARLATTERPARTVPTAPPATTALLGLLAPLGRRGLPAPLVRGLDRSRPAGHRGHERYERHERYDRRQRHDRRDGRGRHERRRLRPHGCVDPDAHRAQHDSTGNATTVTVTFQGAAAYASASSYVCVVTDRTDSGEAITLVKHQRHAVLADWR